MKTGWRLAVNVALWALAFPLVGVVTSLLQKTVYPNITTAALTVPIFWSAFLVWAALIYWRAVPHTPSLLRRAAYFAGFAALMIVVGYLALAAGMLLVIMIFGL